MKARKNRQAAPRTYSLLEEMAASPTEPLPERLRQWQLTGMRASIEAMRADPAPMREHWLLIADMVNLLESLVELGELKDDGGWIAESAKELALSAKRSHEGKALRLTGPGLVAVENALEGYEMAVNALPARTMVRAHRRTEKRISEIRSGKRRSADIEVVSL